MLTHTLSAVSSCILDFNSCARLHL